MMTTTLLVTPARSADPTLKLTDQAARPGFAVRSVALSDSDGLVCVGTAEQDGVYQ